MRVRLTVSYETNITPNRVFVHLFHDIVARFRTKMILCLLSNQRRGSAKTASQMTDTCFKKCIYLWRILIQHLFQATTLAVIKKAKEKPRQLSWQMILAACILALSFATLTAKKGEVTMYVFTSNRCLICSSDHIWFAFLLRCRLLPPLTVRLI